MNPTVLIGLDGATFTVLDYLMENGHMPFLKSFTEKGFRSELMSTANPLTPPAWVSMVTGRNPGVHGVYDFLRWEERKGAVYFILNNSTDIRCETIWSRLSDQGMKATHLNFPIMFPPKPINGFAIPSMVQWRHIKKSVYPEGVVEILKGIPGFKPDEWCTTYGDVVEMMHERALYPEEQEEWVERNILRDRQWFNILKHFMKNEPTDMTAIVFDGVDKLQHLCWRFLDPGCMPEKWLDWERNMQGKVLEYFHNMDAYIDEIVSLAGKEANVFIVSDHGFGPTRYLFHINVLLKKLGHLGWKEYDEKTKAVSQELSFTNLDWEKTSAYTGTPASNAVCIRAPGPPGENTLERGEYLGFREKLRQELLDFRDPENGEQIVTRVITREEAYSGPAVDKAPDLLLTLSDGSFVSVADEEPIVWNRPDIFGTHRPEGILIAGGPVIQQARPREPADILDIAPTLLYSLGLPIPGDYEGRVTTEAVKTVHLEANPLVIGENGEIAETPSSAKHKDSPYSEDEEKEIMDQLRALGYVE